MIVFVPVYTWSGIWYLIFDSPNTNTSTMLPFFVGALNVQWHIVRLNLGLNKPVISLDFLKHPVCCYCHKKTMKLFLLITNNYISNEGTRPYIKYNILTPGLSTSSILYELIRFPNVIHCRYWFSANVLISDTRPTNSFKGHYISLTQNEPNLSNLVFRKTPRWWFKADASGGSMRLSLCLWLQESEIQQKTCPCHDVNEAFSASRCAGNSSGTGVFPSQRHSNADTVVVSLLFVCDNKLLIKHSIDR